MSLLEIIEFPHPILKEETAPVEGINEAIERLVRDMTETMYHAPGSGLAANQVGVGKRLLIADASSSEEEKHTVVVINPRIVSVSDETIVANEGCLSVPDFNADVERAAWVKILGKGLTGEDVEIEADGWMARVLQHEIDHLEGRLYLDRIGRLKRQRYVKRRKKSLVAINKK